MAKDVRASRLRQTLGAAVLCPCLCLAAAQPAHGSARFLAANSQYLDSATLPVAEYPFSIAIKYRRVVLTGNRWMLSMGDTAHNDEYHVLMLQQGGGIPLVDYRRSVNSQSADCFGTVDVVYAYPDNARRAALEWNSAIVIAKSPEDVAVYIDLHGTNSTANVAFSPEFNSFRLGASTTIVPGGYFDGYMAEVVVLNRSMTQAEREDYHYGIDPQLLFDADDFQFYASFKTSLTPEIGAAFTNINNVTIDSAKHPNTLSYVP